jgi:hypothetical protein
MLTAAHAAGPQVSSYDEMAAVVAEELGLEVRREPAALALALSNISVLHGTVPGRLSVAGSAPRRSRSPGSAATPRPRCARHLLTADATNGGTRAKPRGHTQYGSLS